jgi:hypothetical protein
VAATQRCGGASKPYLSAACRTLGVTTPTFSAPRRANDEQDGRAFAGGHPADPGLAKRTAAASAAPVKNSAARRRSDYDGFVSVLTARDRETEHRRGWQETGRPSLLRQNHRFQSLRTIAGGRL